MRHRRHAQGTPSLMYCRPPLAWQAHQPWACRQSPSSRPGARRESASRRRLETHRPAPNYATSGLAPDPAALPATTVREESAYPPIWPGQRPAQRHHLHLCTRPRHTARRRRKRTTIVTLVLACYCIGTILQFDYRSYPLCCIHHHCRNNGRTCIADSGVTERPQ